VDDTLILGIETSCDETAVALLSGRETVLSEYIGSQAPRHRPFGGVVPEVACRAHMEWLLPGLDGVLSRAGADPRALSAVAVTRRPGLIGSLWVGVTAAKALALAWDRPLAGVDHVEAHAAAARLAHPDLPFPHLALVASGGHTLLARVEGPPLHAFTVLASTLDDAAGEAFDKAARLLGLGFPGGPLLEAAARGGDDGAWPWRRACLPPDGVNWSFSGLKTALRRAARGPDGGRAAPLRLGPAEVADAAASFQRSVAHALAERSMEAARRHGAAALAVGGGVAANGALRAALEEAGARHGVRLALPPPKWCADNAVMAAFRGRELFLAGRRDGPDMAASPGR